jgi:flagellar M-ring protein FliF
MEGRYERAVSQALLPVLGWGGGFSATATVDLDLESRQVTTRQMDSAKQAVVSEVNEEQQSQAGGRGGVPGVDANLPERAPANNGSATAGNASNRTTSTLNYAYPTVDEVANRPAGGLRRLSVAVQVDDGRIAQLVEASDGKLDGDALKKQIEAAIRASVGYDAARNDQVTVSYLPFAAAEWTEGTEPAASASSVPLQALPYLVGIAALGLLFWFVVRPIVSAVVRPIAPPEPVLALPGPEGEVVENTSELVNRLRSLVDNYQPVDHDELNHLVASEAEIAADVLRKWTRAS